MPRKERSVSRSDRLEGLSSQNQELTKELQDDATDEPWSTSELLVNPMQELKSTLQGEKKTEAHKGPCLGWAHRDGIAGHDGIRGRLGDFLVRHFKVHGPRRHGQGDLLAWL